MARCNGQDSKVRKQSSNVKEHLAKGSGLFAKYVSRALERVHPYNVGI